MNIRQKVFTLEEANILVPELEDRFSKILQKKEAYERSHDFVLMHELLSQAETYQTGTAVGTGVLDAEICGLETSVQDLENDIREIHRFGCIVRSIDPAWVDFLGEMNGGMVYFCWKKGERSIQYYHDCHENWRNRSALTA